MVESLTSLLVVGPKLTIRVKTHKQVSEREKRLRIADPIESRERAYR